MLLNNVVAREVTVTVAVRDVVAVVVIAVVSGFINLPKAALPASHRSDI